MDFLLGFGLGVAVPDRMCLRESLGLGLARTRGTYMFKANLRLILSVLSLTLRKRFAVEEGFFFWG